jgi:hypothetical protein
MSPSQYIVIVEHQQESGHFRMKMVAENLSQVQACAERYGITYPQTKRLSHQPKIEVTPVFH